MVRLKDFFPFFSYYCLEKTFVARVTLALKCVVMGLLYICCIDLWNFEKPKLLQYRVGFTFEDAEGKASAVVLPPNLVYAVSARGTRCLNGMG